MKKTGFTLVEILIVVIILGILAAIVIPQFTSASETAKESNLKSDLLTVRNQLELYRVQHGDNYPWQIVGNDSDDVIEQLTSKTDDQGAIDDGSDPRRFRYGPYLDKMPVNLFVKDIGNDGQAISLTTGDPDGDSSTGWHVNIDTGRFSANTDDTKFPEHVTW